MYLIQFLLPLRDNEGVAFGQAAFDRVTAELTEHFGGLTTYLRAPAEGAWCEPGGALDRDQVVIFEVMAERVERDWWAAYRTGLEQRFRQQQVLVRASAVEVL